MPKKSRKLLAGCFTILLLCSIATVILGQAMRRQWNENAVTMEPTEHLVLRSTDIDMEGDTIVATCRLTNTTGETIGDAGYSAQFTGSDDHYYGTVLGAVDAVEAGGSIDFRIKLDPAREVTDVSSVELKLELFLPEEDGEQSGAPTK